MHSLYILIVIFTILRPSFPFFSSPMPEDQVSKTITDMMELGKGMPPAISAHTQLFRLEVVPITISDKKKNVTLSDDSIWSDPTKDDGWQTYAPNQRWLDRAEECGLTPLMAIVPYAPLICRSRGKLGCFAAGPHAIVVSYALQSNVIGMPIETYRSIIAEDYPGSNRDRDRAEKELRVFRIPDEYTVPYSSSERRTIKIFAAFVSESWAWVFNDFNSLIMIHVFSRDELWTAADLSPGTPDWHVVFASVKKGGPDWVSETALANANLRLWRDKIRREHLKKHFQASLYSYWPCPPTAAHVRRTHHALITHPKYSYSAIFKPIVSELQVNRCNSFAGIGNYSANELLHELAIHPFTPSYVICEDDLLFEKLETGIYKYLLQFSSPDYLQRASSSPNTANPFAFNEHFNSEFLSKWVNVYQRTTAIVPVPLYNMLAIHGLLDSNHVIGEPYPQNQVLLLDESKRRFIHLPVFRCTGPDNEPAYTVISARVPVTWGVDFTTEAVDIDIKHFSYRTSIGPSQFHVPLLNRPYYDGMEPGTLTGGRPKTERTGKAGRPRKGLTKKRLLRYSKNHTGRSTISSVCS